MSQSVALSFSCQTRCFCPSCQQKRAELFAEKLREEILAPVPHTHTVFTIPIALRRLFLRERRLLGLLTRCAYETVKRCYRAVLGRKDGVPGMVAAIQTFGSQAQWNPHCHCLVAAGLFLPGGEFVPAPPYDEEMERLLTETWQRLVLDALVSEERLTDAFRERLLSFRHGSGFSVYGRHLVLNEEPARLAHMARYAVRAPADRRPHRGLLRPRSRPSWAACRLYPVIYASSKTSLKPLFPSRCRGWYSKRRSQPVPARAWSTASRSSSPRAP